MNKKIAAGVLGIIALSIILVIVFSIFRTSTNESTTIYGDLTINRGEVRTIKNSSTLTVSGDLTVNGSIICDEKEETRGVLHLKVGGTFTLNGALSCIIPNKTADEDNIGIGVYAKKIVMSADAQIFTNGSVEFLSEGKDFSSPAEIARLFADAGKDTGTKGRVGPFTESSPTRAVTKGTRTTVTNPTILLSGTWHIGDEPTLHAERTETERRTVPHPLLYVNAGVDGSTVIEKLQLFGGDGRKGKDIKEVCYAHAEKGGDALRLLFDSKILLVKELTLEMGNGGKGGDARSGSDCEDAVAEGGKGGAPGNMKLSAEMIMIDHLVIRSGIGGAGGTATATGRNGQSSCPGSAGGTATATGGDGGESLYLLSAEGAIDGIEQITLSRAVGGHGGDGFATGGNGGEGANCGCGGGNGGNATSGGGDGGMSGVLLFERTGESHGGDGGDTKSIGGNGGAGGSCSLTQQGGNGGRGGDARSITGDKGNGATGFGRDGNQKGALGGNGGTGGRGCPAGEGAKGGLGAPIGTDGKDGTSLCPSLTPTPLTPTPTPLIEAILYRGHYLPKTALTISLGTGCDEKHWRPLASTVKATDGTILEDPLTPCGYGKISETPLLKVSPTIYNVGTSTIPVLKK